MRLGEITKENYMDYIKLFGGKNAKSLDEMWGKNKKTTETKSDDDINENMVNQYGVKGMSLHYKDDADWKKIVDVPDDIREKLINLAKQEFTENYGMTDGEAQSSLIGKYLASVPESERLSVSWTLQHIFSDESRRLAEYVKENVSGWQYGKPFDRSILADVISNGSIDKKV